MRDLPPVLDRLAGRITNRLIARFPGHPVRIAPKRGIVSFTFDDVPDSALEGARILERHGARGTFYIAAGLLGRREKDRTMIDAEGCRALAAAGHELGCHTYAHPNLRYLGAKALAADLARNEAALEAIDGRRAPRNFAYPYTAGSFRARGEIRRRYRSARGGLDGINRGQADLTYLRGVAIEQPETDIGRLMGLIDATAADPGWLILYGHDVSLTPTPYGCTPAYLERLVAHAAGSGCEVLTVDAALDAMGIAMPPRAQTPLMAERVAP